MIFALRRDARYVTDARMPGRVHGNPFANQLECHCANRRHQAANIGTGDFGTSPIFSALEQAAACQYSNYKVPERKAQWRIATLESDEEAVSLVLMSCI